MEVTEQPFVVWVDHKNLAHIQSAKCLISLFFSLFKFMLMYHPCSSNGKPGVLSQQCSYSETTMVPDIIFLSSQVVAPITWETCIQETLQNQPDPGGGPPPGQTTSFSLVLSASMDSYKQVFLSPWDNPNPFTTNTTFGGFQWIKTLGAMFEPVLFAFVENLLTHHLLDYDNLVLYLASLGPTQHSILPLV